jgi:hypothetical protein
LPTPTFTSNNESKLFFIYLKVATRFGLLTIHKSCPSQAIAANDVVVWAAAAAAAAAAG